MTTQKTRAIFAAAVLSLLVMPLSFAGPARAMYLADGAKQTGPATYENPDDGFCVVGIRANGDMLVDKNITNFRDCAAYTNNLTGLTTQALCAPAAVGTTLPASSTGWRHQWSTSVCTTTGAGGGTGISRVDLDNTTAMCTSKGGIIGPACIAFGWFYRGLKSTSPTTQTVIPITGSPDTVPPFNTSNYAVWQGATATDGLGFCYREMDFTNAPTAGPYVRPTTYPGPGAPNECPMFDPLNPSGRIRTGTSWSDYLWNWDFTTLGPPGVPPSILPVPANGTKCRYAFGVRGIFYSGITASVAGNAYPVGPKHDLTGITTQGLCLANGLSWENWVPKIPAGFVDATVRGVMSATPCGTATDCYAAMDLTTLPKNGGAEFTSRQCLRCHSDQSRGPAERDKPGYVKHGHKLSGDSTDPAVAAIGNTWGEKGVQCAVCHAAANPQMPDIIQRDAAGLAKTTSAHESSQYGAAVTQVCYTCHSDATAGPTGATGGSTTPAAVIPVAGGDFKQNAQHNAPIVNQFLNSPHAEYSGDNTGQQIQDKTKYASPFLGYICRATGPFNGDILTTVYRSGVAETIPNLDTATNAVCTNTGNGSPTSGAATSPGVGAFWVAEGSASSNSQGNCMTCHDPHWSIFDTNPEAEPFRRECTTCHSHPAGETSVSTAPQINLATINHLAGVGTPLEHIATKPYEACEICHMPKSSATGSPMHLWRINTDPGYRTMGATQANTAPDGTFANAAWVDLEHACGQCHGGGTAQDAQHMPVPPAMYRTNAQLALVANGMHASAGITYPTTFSTVANGLTVNTMAAVTCNGTCALTYAWDCGAGGTLTLIPPPAATATCTYSTPGTKVITLTAMENGGNVGSATRNVTLYAPDSPPVAGGLACGTLFAANSWTASFTDASTDDHNAQVIVDWGDGSTSRGRLLSAFSHKYRSAGSYLVVQKVIDTALQLTVAPPCAVMPGSFTIDGHVYKSDGLTGLGSATVTVKSSTTGATVRSVYTAFDGFFSVGSLKPDTYWLVVAKRGYTFPAPTSTGNPAVSVGPNSPGNSIKANP